MSYSSSSDSDNGILTTKNVDVDFKQLEKKGAKIELSDDDIPLQSPPKKTKVVFNAPVNERPRKSFDAQSVSSFRSTASRFSTQSKFSQKTYQTESDRLSQQFRALGLNINEDEFNLECSEKAKAIYDDMLKKNFEKLLKNRKRIQEENRTHDRFNLKKEELYKLSRAELIKQNEKLRTRIIAIKKQLNEKNQEYLELSQQYENLKQD